MVVLGRVVKEKGERVTAEGGSDLRGMLKSINQLLVWGMGFLVCMLQEDGDRCTVMALAWPGPDWTGGYTYAGIKQEW